MYVHVAEMHNSILSSNHAQKKLNAEQSALLIQLLFPAFTSASVSATNYTSNRAGHPARGTASLERDKTPRTLPLPLPLPLPLLRGWGGCGGGVMVVGVVVMVPLGGILVPVGKQRVLACHQLPVCCVTRLLLMQRLNCELHVISLHFVRCA